MESCDNVWVMKENQSQETMAQYQQKWNARRAFKGGEVFALRQALDSEVLPFTVVTDSFGVVRGLGEGEVHCTSEKPPMRMDGRKHIRLSGRMKKQVD